MVKHSKATVAATATTLTGSVPDRKGAGGDIGRTALVQNNGSVDVFIGGAGVTVADFGAKVVPGSSLAVDLGSDEELFAVVATGTSTVHVLHTGV